MLCPKPSSPPFCQTTVTTLCRTKRGGAKRIACQIQTDMHQCAICMKFWAQEHSTAAHIYYILCRCQHARCCDTPKCTPFVACCLHRGNRKVVRYLCVRVYNMHVAPDAGHVLNAMEMRKVVSFCVVVQKELETNFPRGWHMFTSISRSGLTHI